MDKNQITSLVRAANDETATQSERQAAKAELRKVDVRFGDRKQTRLRPQANTR